MNFIISNQEKCLNSSTRNINPRNKHHINRQNASMQCFNEEYILCWGTAVAQWLRRCATNRKVAGSIPVGVSGLFIVIKSFRSHYGPGIDSASNRNEYRGHFLWVKAAGA